MAHAGIEDKTVWPGAACQTVIAPPAQQLIGPGVALQHIGPRPAQHRVAARAALQRVAARKAVQPVMASQPQKMVRPAPAIHPVRPGGARHGGNRHLQPVIAGLIAKGRRDRHEIGAALRHAHPQLRSARGGIGLRQLCPARVEQGKGGARKALPAAPCQIKGIFHPGHQLDAHPIAVTAVIYPAVTLPPQRQQGLGARIGHGIHHRRHPVIAGAAGIISRDIKVIGARHLHIHRPARRPGGIVFRCAQGGATGIAQQKRRIGQRPRRTGPRKIEDIAAIGLQRHTQPIVIAAKVDAALMRPADGQHLLRAQPGHFLLQYTHRIAARRAGGIGRKVDIEDAILRHIHGPARAPIGVIGHRSQRLANGIAQQQLGADQPARRAIAGKADPVSVIRLQRDAQPVAVIAIINPPVIGLANLRFGLRAQACHHLGQRRNGITAGRLRRIGAQIQIIGARLHHIHRPAAATAEVVFHRSQRRAGRIAQHHRGIAQRLRRSIARKGKMIGGIRLQLQPHPIVIIAIIYPPRIAAPGRQRGQRAGACQNLLQHRQLISPGRAQIIGRKIQKILARHRHILRPACRSCDAIFGISQRRAAGIAQQDARIGQRPAAPAARHHKPVAMAPLQIGAQPVAVIGNTDLPQKPVTVAYGIAGARTGFGIQCFDNIDHELPPEIRGGPAQRAKPADSK